MGWARNICYSVSSPTSDVSVTSPVSPLTVIIAPSGMSLVALASCTEGNPYSRAKQEPWANMPPVSSTNPPIRLNTGVHPGSVLSVTSISPEWSKPMSFKFVTTRALAVMNPRLVPTPFIPPGWSLFSNETGLPRLRYMGGFAFFDCIRSKFRRRASTFCRNNGSSLWPCSV